MGRERRGTHFHTNASCELIRAPTLPHVPPAPHALSPLSTPPPPHPLRHEADIGCALQECISEGGLKREDVFLTTKLWVDASDAEGVEAACRQSLRDLGVDQLDLFFMHW
jgi:hypothetical protein